MHAVALGGVRTHVRESALKVDSGGKIPCRTGESNLRPQRAGSTLYQLSYIPARPRLLSSFGNLLLVLFKPSPLAHLHVVGMLIVYVYDINQPSLPTPFYSVLVSISVFTALSTVFHSIKCPDNSLFSHCSSGLFSALLVLSGISLFIKVSFSPDIIHSG